MIDFGDLQADLPSYKNQGSVAIDNVIPLAKGYKSFPSFVKLSDTALASQPVGLFTSFGAAGTVNYSGDQTKLYQMNTSGNFIDKSKSGGYNNSTTEGSKDFWSFVKFGDNVIASNFADNIQVFNEASSSAFADLVSIKAKYLAIIREFVFTAYTVESGTSYYQRVKWSGLNNSSQWTPSQSTQSGFQDIPGSHGAITGIVGNESFGIIFFERAIYRCDYVGTPLIFTFSKIADIGAFSPKSIVSFGNTIYFLAQDGFYSLTNGSDIKPIGSGRINEFFYNDVTSNFEGITSATDPNNSIVLWSYRGSGATSAGSINNKLLIYNYAIDKWSTGSGLSLQFISTASQQGFATLESLDVLGSLDTLPKSLDSYFYGSGIVGLSGFDENNKFGKFLGASLSATIDSSEFEGIENKRSTLINCRPIVDLDGETSVITVTPISRDSQAASLNVGTAVALTESGDCPLRQTSRYHRLRVKVVGNFSTLLGIDVEARPEGKR